VENKTDTVINFYEQSARMMDIAYITAAAFDILTDFLHTCFSDDAYCLKKNSNWCKCKHRNNDVYYDKNLKVSHICRHVIISQISSYYSTNNLFHHCRVSLNIIGERNI